MRAVSVNLIIILQSLNIKRSVMMLLSLNNDKKNAVIKNDDAFTVI